MKAIILAGGKGTRLAEFTKLVYSASCCFIYPLTLFSTVPFTASCALLEAMSYLSIFIASNASRRRT